MIERGILYVAIGERHLEQARRSAGSLKRHHPELPVLAVVRDGIEGAPFDEVVTSAEPDPHVVKAQAVAGMPFEQTLFLDADTWICRRLDSAFDVLERFDVAGVQDGYIQSWKLECVPMAFPELNTGVLFVRRSEVNRAMLDRWVELTRLNPERFRGKQGDQGAFREALYFSDARVATLPPIYNVRLGALSHLCLKAAILHSRDLDLAQIETVINRTGRMRIYDARSGELAVW